jgi:glycosyltransferase involved in cell wall biosynthesis
MAEAQACGTTVIAFGRGGAAEIVDPAQTGVLFEEQSVDSLIDALDRFDRTSFDPRAIRRSSVRFSRERFLRVFRELGDGLLNPQTPEET